MLTQERATALADYLAKDETRAQKLMEMSAEDAVKEFAADGLEITAEELAEFGEAVEQVYKDTQADELDETALESVFGGSLPNWRYAVINSTIMGIYTTYRIVNWVQKHS